MSEAKEIPTVDTLNGYYVSLAMMDFGGSFMRHLGEALAAADAHNYRLIVATWRLQINNCIELWWMKRGHLLKQEDIVKRIPYA